jgi:hypothetical protein
LLHIEKLSIPGMDEFNQENPSFGGQITGFGALVETWSL